MLSDVLGKLYAEECNESQLDTLEEEVHLALALCERDSPANLQVIVFHLLHHLPRFLK